MSHYTPIAFAIAAVVAGATAAPAQGPALPRDTAAHPDAAALFSSFRFRSIGPASIGGRVDDIEVAPRDPNVIYIGYATGGLFKSDNNATTFAPVFETYGTASFGDVAIDPTNVNIVYVGTGEANNRQTSTFGDGIYKSDRRRKYLDEHRPQGNADDLAHRDRPAAILKSSMSRRTDISSDRTPNAACTRRPTAARPGRRSSSSTKTPGSLISRWTDRTQHAVRRELSAASHRVLFQRWRTGQRTLEDRRRRKELGEAERQRPSAGDLWSHRGSTCRGRTPTSCMRRSKRREAERRMRSPRSARVAEVVGGSIGAITARPRFGGPPQRSRGRRAPPPALDPRRSGVYRSDNQGEAGRCEQLRFATIVLQSDQG